MDTDKTILYYARDVQKKLYPLIAKRNLDYISIFIVQKKQEEKIVRSIIPDAIVYNLTQYISDHWNDDRLCSLSLREIESEAKISSIWKLFFTDRFMIYYKYSDAIKFIKLHYLFITEIVCKHHPQFYINEEIALFSSYLFYCICQKYNCKYIGCSVPRNFSYEKILFTHDPYTHYPALDYFYHHPDEISSQEYNCAQSVLLSICNNKTKPTYMNTTGKKPSLFCNYLRPLAVYFKNDFLRKRSFFDYEDTYTFITPRLTYFRYHYQKRYYQKPKKDEKFILFPLHYQPEASTLVKATDFADQIDTIRMIAKNISGDYILYVKEHYAELGHRSNRFYSDIAKIPNVRLIDPWIDSHELLKQSEALIVLTSTMGWEALMYGKPVFTLGKVFYETFKYCYPVNNVFNLAAEMETVLQHFPSKEVFAKEFLIYFASYLKAMHDGCYALHHPDVLSEENVDKLSKALKKEINLS